MSQLEGQEFGQYRLLKRIAMGGMAEIFRARRLGAAGFVRDVVIKRIHPEYSEDEEFVRMFTNEAKFAALLRHPNIVQVIDFDLVDDTYYIAMELIEGADLKRLAQRGRKAGFPIPFQLCLFIVIQSLKGLHHAHQFRHEGRLLSIVHRDISPHNLLLSDQGEVKVTDFGIARVMQQSGVTASGVLKGKVSYMAPEQTYSSRVDHRADLFAMGVILWELLCRRRLFSGSNDLLVVDQVRELEIPWPHEVDPRIPKELSAVVMQALSRDVSQRTPDAQVMMLGLQRFLWLPNAADELSLYMRHVLHDAPLRADFDCLDEFHPPLASPSMEALASAWGAESHEQETVGLSEESEPAIKEKVGTQDLGPWRPPKPGEAPPVAAERESTKTDELGPKQTDELGPKQSVGFQPLPELETTCESELDESHPIVMANAPTVGVKALRRDGEKAKGTMSVLVPLDSPERQISSSVAVQPSPPDWMIQTEAFSSPSQNLELMAMMVAEGGAEPGQELSFVETVQVNPEAALGELMALAQSGASGENQRFSDESTLEGDEGNMSLSAARRMADDAEEAGEPPVLETVQLDVRAQVAAIMAHAEIEEDPLAKTRLDDEEPMVGLNELLSHERAKEQMLPVEETVQLNPSAHLGEAALAAALGQPTRDLSELPKATAHPSATAKVGYRGVLLWGSLVFLFCLLAGGVWLLFFHQ